MAASKFAVRHALPNQHNINDTLYIEASAYRTLDFKTQNDLGTDPFGAPGTLDFAPYWRVAFEPHWGNNWLEIGTFGRRSYEHNCLRTITSQPQGGRRHGRPGRV